MIKTERKTRYNTQERSSPMRQRLVLFFSLLIFGISFMTHAQANVPIPSEHQIQTKIFHCQAVCTPHQICHIQVKHQHMVRMRMKAQRSNDTAPLAQRSVTQKRQALFKHQRHQLSQKHKARHRAKQHTHCPCCHHPPEAVASVSHHRWKKVRRTPWKHWNQHPTRQDFKPDKVTDRTTQNSPFTDVS